MDNFWKDKTIVAYIALAHHTRFIIPVMEHLSARGARVRYIVGQAERSQEITAIDKGLEYSHIFDFISQKDNDAVKENYLALKNTFSAALKNDFLLGMSPVTVIDKTLYSTAMEYIGFKNLFKKEKPDLCFALHELNRWGKMFSFWAKKNNVPFVTLQEGLGYNLDFGYTGHAQYSSLNLVWGERIKKKFTSYEVPEDKIMLTGNIHLASEIKDQRKNKTRKIKRREYNISDHFVTLLLLSAKLPSPSLYTPLFNAISKNNHLKLIVKFHPACKKQQMDSWKDKVPDKAKKDLSFIHAQENVYDLISMADLCVLDQPSTTGLEALAFDKPLVKMDFGYSAGAPYSFVDQGVATRMTAKELSNALENKTDFYSLVDNDKKKLYLKNELFDTDHAIDNVCNVFKKLISANKDVPSPVSHGCTKPEKAWSIILPVPEHPKTFLSQLEALVVNSEGQGEYEIIFLEPETISEQIGEILDSLKGDFKRVVMAKGKTLPETMNQAGETATGKHLLFLEKNLAPLAGWLESLQKASAAYGKNKVFGARICDNNGRLINAGTIVDINNSPACAYRHLNIDFDGALKERSFQMTDLFVAIEKDFFLKIGGFSPLSGNKKFMDLCLKAKDTTKDINSTLYLPGLKMILLDDLHNESTPDEAIYFYGKWHGVLWESENRLLKADGVSLQDVAHAKLSKAMQTMK